MVSHEQGGDLSMYTINWTNSSGEHFQEWAYTLKDLLEKLAVHAQSLEEGFIKEVKVLYTSFK